MRHFWKGFREKKLATPVRFKKHVLILYWTPEDQDNERLKNSFKKVSIRHPSIAVKIVDAKRCPQKSVAHRILSFPTVLLLRDGREIGRLDLKKDEALLENFFQKAST